MHTTYTLQPESHHKRSPYAKRAHQSQSRQTTHLQGHAYTSP